MSSKLDFTKSTLAKGLTQDVVTDSVCITTRLTMAAPSDSATLRLLSGTFSRTCRRSATALCMWVGALLACFALMMAHWGVVGMMCPISVRVMRIVVVCRLGAVTMCGCTDNFHRSMVVVSWLSIISVVVRHWWAMMVSISCLAGGTLRIFHS